MVVTHDIEIHKIHYDSRKVGRDDCFVAIRGTGTDGHKFINDAFNKGASVIVMEDDDAVPDSLFMHVGCVKVVVPNARKALAVMASNFYSHPSRKLKVVGVTGTNGKTTTSYLIQSILEASGERTGLIGTIEYRIGDKIIPATHTTPESLELNELLAEMIDHRCTSVSMEVSSHALHQSRVHGINFNVAAFTNLTQDHLDYHGSMEEYFRAKKILFDELKPTGWAVVNQDDPNSLKIIESTGAHVLTYGTSSSSNVRAKDIQLSIHGTTITIQYAGEVTTVSSPLVGRFNVYNILAAFSAGVALRIPKEKIKSGISSLQSVKGRFERIASSKGWMAIIDYAHTPDALEKCLWSIRELLPNGRIITVFGAGGDRDMAKRPQMGRIAGALSDVSIVTSDNPRTEDPERIIAEIVNGFPAGVSFTTEVNRRAAIERALRMANSGDVVLIAGKGHEEYQIIGKEKIHFSDREVVKEFV